MTSCLCCWPYSKGPGSSCDQLSLLPASLKGDREQLSLLPASLKGAWEQLSLLPASLKGDREQL